MDSAEILTPEQCLGARAMLRITREQLALKSLVAVATIADFEMGRHKPHRRTKLALRESLEGWGVIFIPADGVGSGVRLKKGN